jgi:putative DNA primase/helicase
MEVDLDDALEHSEAIALSRVSDNTRSDTGNADRLVRTHKGRLLCAEGIGWHSWDGKRWRAEAYASAYRAARDTAKNIHAEATEIQRRMVGLEVGNQDWKVLEGMAKRTKEWARASEQHNHIDSTLKNAAQHEAFHVKATELDTNPILLNVSNGTLVLPTLEEPEPVLHPHDPADRITKVSPASYDPGAPAASWGANMERFVPDANVRAFLQRCAGAGLYGYRSREILYLYGLGANFKSSYLRGIREALGDYAYVTDPDLLVSSSRDPKSVSDKAMIAELQGRRFVTTSEIDEGQALAEGMVKVLTEDKLRGEFKHQRGFEFEPQYTIAISANHMLTVRGTDDGIYDRIHMVEFGVRLDPSEKNTYYFEQHLLPELDGILAWAVRGAQDYAARGFRTDPPERVLAWTAAYRLDQDVFARWLESECELDPDGQVERVNLWENFVAFLRAENARGIKQSQWKKSLFKAGIEERYVTGAGRRTWVYSGISLKIPPI